MAKIPKSIWSDLQLPVSRRSFPETERFVALLRELHLNGMAWFGSFRFPTSGPFLTIAKQGELIQSGFFDHLWQTEAVRQVLPELAAEPGFQCRRPFTQGNPFTLDGEFASALFCGGVYRQFKGTAAEAKAAAVQPATELLGIRFERSAVYTNHTAWCSSFDGMVDWTWVVLNFQSRLLHVVSATDVD